MLAACNGLTLPEGYTVGKATGTPGPKVWIIRLCGKRIATRNRRVDAIAYVNEHSKANHRPTVAVDEQGVDEETSARLRAHRVDAGSRCG